MEPKVFVTTIDATQAKKLRAGLEEQGFSFSTPQYTVFQARKEGISVTLYTSKKLTVMGRNKSEFITFYLEPEILHTFTFSHPEASIDHSARIGVDESGKGDFFGPLCIASVYGDESSIKELTKMGVRDSKAMRDPQIIKLAKQIRARCPHNLIQIYPKKYNELYAKFKNLNSLLAWGHATAIEKLVLETECTDVIIDQFASEHVVENALKKKSLTVSLTQRHRGEEDVIVAAASILARACFVEGMHKLSQRYGLKLPYGASAQVIAAGRQLVGKHGRDALAECAKLHFKTASQVLN